MGESAFRYIDEGTTIVLRADSKLAVDEIEGVKVLRLDAGVLTADVAKQESGKELVVRTAHAEMKVVGTKFKK